MFGSRGSLQGKSAVLQTPAKLLQIAINVARELLRQLLSFCDPDTEPDFVKKSAGKKGRGVFVASRPFRLAAMFGSVWTARGINPAVTPGPEFSPPGFAHCFPPAIPG